MEHTQICRRAGRRWACSVTLALYGALTLYSPQPSPYLNSFSFSSFLWFKQHFSFFFCHFYLFNNLLFCLCLSSWSSSHCTTFFYTSSLSLLLSSLFNLLRSLKKISLQSSFSSYIKFAFSAKLFQLLFFLITDFRPLCICLKKKLPFFVLEIIFTSLSVTSFRLPLCFFTLTSFPLSF